MAVPITTINTFRIGVQAGHMACMEYERISNSLSQCLSSALAEVCDRRPADPIDFIARYLRAYGKTLGQSPDTEQTIAEGEALLAALEDMSAENTYEPSMELPEVPTVTIPADKNVTQGYGASKWPIRDFAALDLNVNAKHGGCAAIILVSNSYGGKGPETTAEAFLYRSGFDGNNFACTSLAKCHSGHFGPDTGFVTSEEGDLIGNCMFGNNHLAVLSSDARHGHHGHGVFVKGPAEGSGSSQLPLNVNGARDGQAGAGCSIVICSGWQPDAGEAKLVHATYMIRSGFKDNFAEAILLKGDNKWTFQAQSDQHLHVIGPDRSDYSIYHNRDNMASKPAQAKSRHFQALNGTAAVTLINSVPTGCLLVLCSNSSGVADATVASLYQVTLSSNTHIVSTLIQGSVGKKYNGSTADLWKFSVENGNLIVTGPAGPCRYAFISNIVEDGIAQEVSGKQTSCLATGDAQPINGAVKITNDAVIGCITSPSKIVVKLEEKLICVFEAAQLKDHGGKWAFHRNWAEEEKRCGLQLARVFAVRKHTKDNKEEYIELSGSPTHLVRQPPGVAYALNCGGPAFEASTGIVYTSEHRQFASFTYDWMWGSRNRALGGNRYPAQFPHILTGSFDGFLYCSVRTSGVEPIDEQRVQFKVENIANGNYTMRLHWIWQCTRVSCNGQDLIGKMEAIEKQQPPLMAGYHCYEMDVPIKVDDGTLQLNVKGAVAGFALLDITYKTKEETEEEKQAEIKMKQMLADQAEPLQRTMALKAREIVGWSPNLLKNASAEEGMKHWEVRGDWKQHEDGYGREKAFKTSHMECTKYQVVDLTEHFSTDYLDTAPAIQVTEWYREGVCGGGFYYMDATLLSDDGTAIKNYNTGRIGRIYKDMKWQQASVTFTGYGPGVRQVRLQSMGKDDKFWAGHYGTLMSAAVIRVKRESIPAKDDAYEDIVMVQDKEAGTGSFSVVREKLIAQILAENKDTMATAANELAIDEKASSVIRKRSARRVSARRRRKREVRVFVSSTFRDFTRERETLIKKTFRELEHMCQERGVFLTYVDLRWGITEDQTNHGQTIAICLQEIDRCSPYFLCMMGERFGWSQSKDNPDELLNSSMDFAITNFAKTMGWIDNNRYDSSVTQLEIMHAVLNNVAERQERSFFYLRDPVQPGSLPPKEFRDMSSESPWHKERQYALRSKVESIDQLNKRKYKHPEEACQLIKQDLQNCLDKDFPRGTELTPLEREWESHEAFAEARRRVYIGRREYFEEIENYVAKRERTPLVILGESGSGKSALVANWVGKVQQREPNTFVFVHFIGSTAESASYLSLLRRLYEEIKRFFSIDLPVPTTDQALIRDLSVWLKMAGAHNKCLIVLDALNQLDEGLGTEGNEHDLLWLPRELPPGVSMVLSTLPGRAMEAVKVAGWNAISVKPLVPAEKCEIVTGYFEQIYGKTLSQDQVNMIVDNPQTNNPLYLRVILDEVRLFGRFRELTRKIEDYLSAKNAGELFGKILERLEDDFEKGQHVRPGLVKQTTSAIWCSQRGMSEAELLDFLQVPSAVWSPFYLSLVDSLVNRNGILNFFHDYLRQAVEAKYLPNAEAKKQGYVDLANFFSPKPISDRVVDELPFLLARAGELERLRTCLSDLEVFRRMVKTEDGKFELIRYWKLLGDFSEAEKAYAAALSKLTVEQLNTDEMCTLQQDLAEFFMDLGLYDAARSTFEKLLKQLEAKHEQSNGTLVYKHFSHEFSYRCQHPQVLDLLHKLGAVCEKQKNLNQAAEYYRDAIKRQNRIRDPNQKIVLTEGLLGMATVLYLQENMKEAKKYLIRARELATDVLGPRHHIVAAILNKLGQLAYKQTRLKEAMTYYLEDLHLTRREVGTEHPRTAGILNDLALVYDDDNNPIAGQLYEEALRILLDMYGKMHLDVAVVRYNLGAFYFATNYFARSKFQFEEAAKIFQTFLGADHTDTKEAQFAIQDVTAFV